MEYKQEASQSKPPTKSYRRRQRRKEAAALQKLAASVISQKVESSVEYLEKLSDENINTVNKNSVSEDNLKKVDEITKTRPSHQNFGRKSNQASANREEEKSTHVIQEKKSGESEVSHIPCLNRGSNKKKVLSADDRVDESKNINNKERKSCLDVAKTDDNTLSNELCPSVKVCSTPKKLNKKDNKNSSLVSGAHLKSSVVVQGGDKNCPSNFGDCEKSVAVEKCTLKKRETDATLVLKKVEGKAKSMDDNLKKNTVNRPSENLDITVNNDLLGKEDHRTTIDSTVSNDKSEDVKNNPDNLESSGISFDREQNQSSFVFQQTGIYSFHITRNHPDTEVKDQSAIPENSSDIKSTVTSENKMNKTGGNVTKSSSEQVRVSSTEVLKGKNDKCISEAADKEGFEKDTSEKSRDQVKAEREARKAAKQLKKQKEKAPPNVKDVRDTNTTEPLPVVSEPSVDRIIEKTSEALNESDSLATPTQNNESSENKKSKAELRAERRAKQEAQRAAKTVTAGVSTASTPSQSKAPVVEKSTPSKSSKAAGLKSAPVKVVRKTQGAKLLSRLGLEESRSQNWRQTSLLDTQSIHPAIVQLSTRFTDRIISGSNARCIAFVQAIKKAILDYQTPPQKELARDLEARLLAPSLEYLKGQRPHAVSVSNATRFLKWQLTHLQPLQDSSTEKKTALPDEKAKHTLIEGLDSYIWEKIEVAERAVCITLRDKIKDGDMILTYGCSYLLQQIFVEAKKAGTMFKVVVVDGRPWKEGREMLRCLVSVGIPCSYVLLSAASSVMRQVNKVILGAHALLSNGYVMSRVGVSQVALLASAHNVPVLVACETHKFCERVQSDSFNYNEIGEPDGLAQLLGGEEGPLSEWKTLPSLSLLNLSYDVTPPELVTAVATELAVLPCTSVPVVLRVRPMEPVTSRH